MADEILVEDTSVTPIGVYWYNGSSWVNKGSAYYSEYKVQYTDIDYKVFFNALPYCGMRRAEVLGLEYGDINFSTGEVMIVRTSNYQNADTGVYTSTPKTETGYRELIFPPNILSMIKQLKRSQQLQAYRLGDLWHESDRLFVTWNGLPMHPNTPYTWLQRFCKDTAL